MSVLKMMLFSVGLTSESGAAYVSESLGRNISENTIRNMMRAKASVPVDVVDCLKARQQSIIDASIAFTNWIEDSENQDENGVAMIPHTHNADTDIAKLALAQAMLKTGQTCSISQK
ncbi:hypothetical protein N9W89_02665 [Hellea sp.]|nr:hypothetical protein [Hellea sp.]